MDYITLYLIMATVILLFINSLIVVSNMDLCTSDSGTSNFKGKGVKETERTKRDQSSGLSVGTNSAAILGITLFLLVNFESAMSSNLVVELSEFFSNFYGYGEQLPVVSVLNLNQGLGLAENDTLFCQASTSFKYFSKFLLLLTFIVIISVKPYILKETGLLVLLSTAGILLMASSTNFISFYLALELISLASYILVSTTITDCEQTKKEITSTEQPWEVSPNTPKPREPNKLKNSYVSLLVYADNSIVAGLNYFLLSALSSGLLILGISLIYYTTGELDFNSLARIFSSNSVHVESTINGGFLPQSHCTHLPQPSVESGIGMCLVMTFVLFKLGASPFHYWVADVYEKVSIFVNYFLIVVAKLAMLFALMKLSFGMNLPLVENLLIVAAVSSLLIGSFAGLVQTKLRRLMAFSSINHVGYILLAYSFSLTKKVFEPESFSGVSDCDWERNQLLGLDQGSMIITEFSKLSIASLWLYVTIYSLSTVCFFAILSLAVENGKQDHKSVNLSTNLTLQKLNTFAIFNVKGGGASHEVYALSQGANIPSPIFITASFTITLLSLAGVPPLAGFIAKIAIFWQVLDSGNWFLATIAVLCSVIAAIYYLRIVALLYFHAAHPGVAVVTDPKKHSLNDSAAANATHSKQTTTPTESLDVKALPSSVNITFLTALIIASITIIIVVFPILNPSFMYLYMING